MDKVDKVAYLLQGKNIILVIDGKSHTINKDTHVAYAKIVEALKAGAWDDIRNLISPKKFITDMGNGNISFDGNKILWKGNPFHNALTARMIEMIHDGLPVDSMVLFMENLMKNPSKRSVDQLYGFLEKNNLPITQDGHFLAFKKVRKDYFDIHSGTISNHVGAVVEMDRNLVDDDPNSTCSSGLHFCSESYLKHFGSPTDPIMILKINPADVVSIPTDYNGAKGRCMKYVVVAEVSGSAAESFAKVVNGSVDESESAEIVKTTLASAATWPFASPIDDEGTDEELYDLIRVHGGWAEYTDMTLDEARAQLNKNIAQKKAMLKIVKSGTDEEVK